jgi:serine/threonine protein kinase/formylglycine-generating enzyme required for sulfatase activity
MLPPETVLQNRYRVLRELGHGGMGTVYEARDQRVNCIVALKETLAGHDTDGRRAFEREASLLANLRHPSLPKVMDYFTEGDGDFLVMEYVPGYDLAELSESREGPFPQAQVLRWADQLLRVLEYLHGQDPPILHRDIKPSNLKLTKEGEIFLLDFGLAKGALGQTTSLLTSHSVRGYTPVYASLEQIHGFGTDPRSDLYSLGATLYHLLTGRAPADAPTRFHMLEDDHPDPLRPILELNPQASANVAAVIEKSMTVNRKQRMISAAEMRRAFRNAVEEDERAGAEQEYARAEARRRERDQEKETRKKPDAIPERPQPNPPAAKPVERPKVSPKPPPPLAPPLRSDTDQTVAAKEKESDVLVAPTIVSPGGQPVKPLPPPMKTLVAPPPERITHPQGSGETERSFDSFNQESSGNRGVLIGVGAVVLILAAIGIWWALSGRSENAANTSAAANKPGAGPATPTPPAGMVYVPGGTFMMGRDNGADVAEQPEHSVTVAPFFIDTYEVALNDYLASPAAQKLEMSAETAAAKGRRPMTGLNWNDANQYCLSIGKRLPTEEEWEFAARGTDGRVYPWGNSWTDGSANAASARKELVPVGTFTGASPFGACDMVGNAWEWTSTDFRAYPGGRLPPSVPAGELKVIRGGSYESTKAFATTTYRTGWPARGASTYDQTGFRCVKSIAP